MTNEKKQYQIELIKNAISETIDYIGEAVSMGNLAEARDLRFAVSELRKELIEISRS